MSWKEFLLSRSSVNMINFVVVCESVVLLSCAVRNCLVYFFVCLYNYIIVPVFHIVVFFLSSFGQLFVLLIPPFQRKPHKKVKEEEQHEINDFNFCTFRFLFSFFGYKTLFILLNSIIVRFVRMTMSSRTTGLIMW
jgi:hypothetical protein